MITIDDVINFILSTDDLTALPTVMDALTQRVASELGMTSDIGNAEEPTDEDITSEEGAEEVPTDENQAVYF